MAKGGGISGLGVAGAALGAYLIYAGLRDVPLMAGLRELAAGQLPRGRPPVTTPVDFIGPIARGPDASDASRASSRLEAAARTHLGVPYRWAGHDPSGWDCSGFVTYVLHHDLGVDLTRWSALGRPLNNTHVVTGQWLVSNIATTIKRSDARSGDLACYAGHIGIVVGDGTSMIHAPHAGTVTKIARIYGAPAIRRLAV